MAKKDRDYILYLEDMLVNLKHAIEYIEGMNFEAFCNDSKTQNATVRCMEITGEAAHNVPDDFKQRYSDLDWDDMYAFRIKAAHHYFDIDLSLVWQILTQHVPKTILDLERVMAIERAKKDGEGGNY